MLTRNIFSTVKETVPLLAEHSQTITDNFYKRLLKANPELCTIVNWPSAIGGRQQNALTEAVIECVSDIDNISVLKPAIKKITQKYRNTGVSSELYPVVGQHLLEAIREVLKLPVNHPALKAFDEVYQQLADGFTTSDECMEFENQKKINWVGFQAFRINKIQRETPEVISLWLKPVDENIVIDYQAGQYVSVMIPSADNGYDQIRQYSIADWDAEKSSIRISVKTESHGIVCPFIHVLKLDNEVQVSPPEGVFTLNTSAQKHTFISAGIGITPLFAMLKEAVKKHKISGNKISFIQCNRSKTHQIFRAELTPFCKEQNIELKQIYELDSYGDYQGRLSTKQLKEWVDLESSDVYYCGPKLFMNAVNKELLDSEIFGPTTPLNYGQYW